MHGLVHAKHLIALPVAVADFNKCGIDDALPGEPQLFDDTRRVPALLHTHADLRYSLCDV